MRPLLIKYMLYLCAWLPLPLLHGMGWLLGWGLILVPNRSRDTTAVNIALCWPELTAAGQRGLLRASLRETGKTIMEAGALWLRRGERTLGLIRRVEGESLVEGAVEQGRGLILVSPHLGAWEMVGLYCAARYNITCLYRPLKMPELEELVQTARTRLGGSYVPATAQGIRILYKTLARGDTVAMLPDQEPRAGTGIFAPFFGVPAYSMVLLGRLASKTAAPVIFMWCERLSWGRGYHIKFSLARSAVHSASLNAAVAATNQTVEDCIRECPEQYQWSYRRFRTRPEGEPFLYPKRPG